MPEVSPRLRNAPAHHRARARDLRSLRRPDPPAPLGDPVHPEGRRLVRHRLSVDRKSTRLNSSHEWISYAVFCLKKKKQICKGVDQSTNLELVRIDLVML